MRVGAGAAAVIAAAAVFAGCSDGGSASAGTNADRPRAHDSGRATLARPRPGETLAAAVRRPVALLSKPSPGAREVARVGRRTEFGSRSVMAVVRRRGAWLGVTWPSLDNGAVGWVRSDRVQLLREPWRILIDLSERRATLLHEGREFRSFAVAVGAQGTPTPTGTFGVTDRLRTGGPGSPYGCCVLALSGRQPDVPQEWPGGDRLAVHGTNAPSSIGRAASHGCLRAGAATMRMLMARVPLGAQVVIRA